MTYSNSIGGPHNIYAYKPWALSSSHIRVNSTF